MGLLGSSFYESHNTGEPENELDRERYLNGIYLLHRQATELFDDIEEQLEYMEDYGFDAARIHVLELHKRFADAAAVALSERNILECVRLLLCSHEGSLIRQAVVHGIHGLWTLLPYGATGPQINNPAISSLLQRLSTIDANLLDEHEQRQVGAEPCNV